MTKSELIGTAIGVMATLAALPTQAQTFNAHQRDSLMTAAEHWRAMGNNTAALNIYAQVGTERARVETADTHIEMGQIAMALREAQSMLKDKEFRAKDDALLIVARCRDKQGFTSAANRAYRKLAKHGHAEGLYYAALRKYTSGHLKEAESLCQRAVASDANVIPAHQLLGAIEISMGHRYKALLPLYYYALVASDEGRSMGLKQIRAIWRKSAKAIDMLHTQKETDPFNDKMDEWIDQLATDSISKVEGYDAIMMLTDKTSALFGHVKESGMENIDFWQIHYGDFMSDIERMGYTRPMVFFICSGTWPETVSEWVKTEYGGPLFNEFMLWADTRIKN